MKNIKTAFCLSLLPLLLISCNKDSLIEGIESGVVVTPINKTCNFNTVNDITITLQVGNTNNYTITLQNFKIKGGITVSPFVATDSVDISRLYINSGASLFSIKSNSFIKYKKGDAINGSSYAYISPAYLQVCKKSVPYSSIFTSVNTIFTYGVVIQPQFFLNEDGYLAFRILAANTTNGTMYYYGWIHIIMGQNDIMFDKWGYQYNKILTAGEE